MSDRGGRFIVGLVGAGIGSSLSPELHEREADELGLRYIYQLIDIADLGLAATDVGSLVAAANRLGFRGLNITHPCKQVVVEHLDELAGDAATLGAVNTVVFAGGRAIGHNTDGLGFLEGFRRGLPDAAVGDVVLIGAGGAGTAVAQAMLRLGTSRLTVIDVDLDRARRLKSALDGDQESLSAARESHGGGPESLGGGGRQSIRVAGVEALADCLLTADGLINATPIGMTPHHGTPVPAGLLRPDLWVADIIYRPIETELLHDARLRGCRTLHGGAMVAFQAAEAMRLFTGLRPDAERMYQHLSASIGENHA